MTLRLLSLLVLLAAPPAMAQPATAQAESLFRDGRALMKEGKLAEACTAFEGSQKLEPAITTLLNLGDCREKAGQLASAWGAFVEAARTARDASDAATQKLYQVARKHAHELEPRVSRLTIHVRADRRIDGLEIVRGDAPIDASAWDRALPIDGGTYTIAARAPGAAPWSTTVTIGAEGDSKTVEIPKLTSGGAAAPPSRVTATVVAQPQPSAQRSQLVPIALGAVAVASIGGAIGFELWGESTYDRSKQEGDPTMQDALWHSANDKRYAAEGLAVAGVACAGVAVWLWLRRPSSGRESSAVAPTSRGFALVGAF